jgi:hypothetical protein
MKKPRPRQRAHDSTGYFENQIRADLRKRRWLRVHVTLIGLLTFLSCWGISSALLHLGVESLAMRHAGALLGAYGVYLLLLWMWSHYLLSRNDVTDLADIPTGGGVGGRPSPGMRPGGGDFGGGGASSSWADGAAPGSSGAFEGVGRIASGAADALGDADDAAVVAIPIAIVVGIAALMAAAMGFAVFGLFGIEVLMGVAVEIAFASAGGAIALKARRQGWMTHAIRSTAGPMAVVLVASVLGALAVSYALPEAKTLPDAIRLIMQAF